MKITLTLLFLFVLIVKFNGQVIGLYDFTGAGICPNPNINVTTQPLDATFSSFSSLNVNCSSANDVYNTSGWNTTDVINLSEYNEFSIISNECFSFDLTSIIFSHRVSNVTSIPTWHLRSSLDNFSTEISTGNSGVTLTPTTINLPPSFGNLSTLTFRFYLTSATASTTTWRNDHIQLIGNIYPIVPDVYFADVDGDSFGNPDSFISACSSQLGYVLNGQDCNDSDAGINPNTSWFEDLDLDGFGNPEVSIIGCTPSLNYVFNNTDCDDSNSSIQNPVDIFYLDYDLDGFGDPLTTIVSCVQPEGYVSNQLDCDDLNNLITVPTLQFYQDLDLDGYGNSLISQINCTNPSGFVLDSTDCDDTNPLIYYNALDLTGNGIDENCDGVDGYLLLNETQANKLKVTTELNNKFLTFSIIDSKEVLLVQVLDMIGNEIYTNFNLSPIDVSKLKNGFYMLYVTSPSSIFRQRIYLTN